MSVGRRDRFGRRIGYNWWRDYNCSILLDATLVWERQCEEATSLYHAEVEDYRREFPVPNLKQFLIANRGMNRKD